MAFFEVWPGRVRSRTGAVGGTRIRAFSLPGSGVFNRLIGAHGQRSPDRIVLDAVFGNGWTATPAIS